MTTETVQGLTFTVPCYHAKLRVTEDLLGRYLHIKSREPNKFATMM